MFCLITQKDDRITGWVIASDFNELWQKVEGRAQFDAHLQPLADHLRSVKDVINYPPGQHRLTTGHVLLVD